MLSSRDINSNLWNNLLIWEIIQGTFFLIGLILFEGALLWTALKKRHLHVSQIVNVVVSENWIWRQQVNFVQIKTAQFTFLNLKTTFDGCNGHVTFVINVQLTSLWSEEPRLLLISISAVLLGCQLNILHVNPRLTRSALGYQWLVLSQSG